MSDVSSREASALGGRIVEHIPTIGPSLPPRTIKEIEYVLDLAPRHLWIMGELPPDLPDRIADSAYIFLFGEDNFWVGKDETVRILVIDVAGKPFTILAGTDAAADFPFFIEVAEPILESLRFAPS